MMRFLLSLCLLVVVNVDIIIMSVSADSQINVPFVTVNTTIGGEAAFLCNYPTELSNEYPYIVINDVVILARSLGDHYSLTYREMLVNGESYYSWTLKYNIVTARDNGTTVQFAFRLGRSGETISDKITLYVYEQDVEVVESIKEKETLLSSETSYTVSIILKSTMRPSGGSSQLSTTAIIVIGVVCGGVCLVMLGIMGVTCILVFCVKSGKVYSPKGEAVPEVSLTSDDVKIEKNPAYATVEKNTASEVSLTFDDVKIEKNPAYATLENDITPRAIYSNL